MDLRGGIQPPASESEAGRSEVDIALKGRTINNAAGKSRRLAARQGAKEMADTGPQRDDDDVATDEELEEALDLTGLDPKKVLGDD